MLPHKIDVLIGLLDGRFTRLSSKPAWIQSIICESIGWMATKT